MKFEQEVKSSLKIDEDIVNFFKNYFRTVPDLKKFSISKFNYKVKKTRRADIEKELAKISSFKELNIEKLKNYLGRPIVKIQKTTTKTRRKPSVKTPILKVKDQTAKWMSLTSEELRNELNDMNLYPDYKSLKQASYSVLKPNEKRFRIREKIVNIIVERISEEKAIAHLGR